MNHPLTILLVNSTYYLAIITWVILALMLLVFSFRRQWAATKRVLKFAINSVVFIVILAFYMEMALVVLPPVGASKLYNWTAQHVLNDLTIALVITLLLFVINYFFYRKIENLNNKIDLLILFIIDATVLVYGAWLAGQDAYYGLLEEINRRG